MLNPRIPIPSYCENEVTSLIDQPINVLSDLSFFIAWFLLIRKFGREKVTAEIKVLVWLLFLVAMASAFWHANPNAITSVFDRVLPMTFISVAIFIAVKFLSKNKIFASIFATTHWIVLVSLIFFLPSNPVNGTIRHSLTATTLVGLITWLIRKHPEFKSQAVTIFLVYAGGIVLRVLDGVLCGVIPFGTHSLWHIASAVASYLIVNLLHQLRTSKHYSDLL